eukprot:CAMPEP_0194293978 /NCGR_PEP_ID=MMETSP0169-20130528/49213_1 /TAXON_ID=218684 /ORGANISM="Corethron pennatum, Strain L29A3" /LENGTH=246 /DNA_ID=CAMNT_0039042677 /DNA_START=84 /DNA_END=820 /DNA_ORIENTATION=+
MKDVEEHAIVPDPKVLEEGLAPPHGEKQIEDSRANVSLSKLFSYSDASDRWLVLGGTICAIGSGVIRPLQVIAFGDLMNAFNPIADPSEAPNPDVIMQQIGTVCLYFVGIAVFAFVAGIGQVFFWDLTASRQNRRLRSEFLRSALRQEVGWFDTGVPDGLAASAADAALSVRDGTGRKFADFLQYGAQAVAGIGIALVRGWKLGLSVLAWAPILAGAAYLMMRSLSKAVKGGSAAYAEAAGVAQEA